MKTEIMLNRTYEMLNCAIMIADDKAEENIRQLLMSEGSAFGDTIRAIQADIQDEYAKKTGRSKQLAAAKRIIKSAIRDDLRGSWTEEDTGRQCLCSGYHALYLCNLLPLSEIPKPSNIELNQIVERARANANPLNLPSIGETKVFLTTKKAEARNSGMAKKQFIYDFGDRLPAVNAQYLVDMLEALPYAKAYYKDEISPIYFASEDGEGVLVPIRKGKQ